MEHLRIGFNILFFFIYKFFTGQGPITIEHKFMVSLKIPIRTSMPLYRMWKYEKKVHLIPFGPTMNSYSVFYFWSQHAKTLILGDLHLYSHYYIKTNTKQTVSCRINARAEGEGCKSEVWIVD